MYALYEELDRISGEICDESVLKYLVWNKKEVSRAIGILRDRIRKLDRGQ